MSSTAGGGQGQERLRSEIELRRRQAEGEGFQFTPLPDQELRKESNVPFVLWQAWTPTVPPGGTLILRVGLANLGPQRWPWLFTHVFVGPANVAVDLAPRGVGEALAAVDSRFPRLTLPQFPGLRFEAGGFESLSFSFRVPSTVERTNYLGNCFLFQSTWHDPGRYLDRSLFVFEVS